MLPIKKSDFYLYLIDLFMLEIIKLIKISYFKIKMINGLRVTQIPIVRKGLQLHKKKLKQISSRKLIYPELYVGEHGFKDGLEDSRMKQQKSIQKSKLHSSSLSLSRSKGFANLSTSQCQLLKKKKENHLKSVQFHKLKKDFDIDQQNGFIYERLIRISQRKDFNNLEFQQGKQKSIHKNKQVNTQKRKMGKDFVYRKRQMMVIQATNSEIGKRILNKTGYYDHQKDLNDYYKTRQILRRMGKFNMVNKLMQSPKRSNTMPNKLPKLYTQATQEL